MGTHSPCLGDLSSFCLAQSWAKPVDRQSNNATKRARVLFMRKSLNLWADERQLGACRANFTTDSTDGQDGSGFAWVRSPSAREEMHRCFDCVLSPPSPSSGFPRAPLNMTRAMGILFAALRVRSTRRANLTADSTDDAHLHGSD